MPDRSISTNPLGWVQLRLLGGAGRIITTVAVYVVAVPLAMVVIYRFMQDDQGPGWGVGQFAEYALAVMCYIEGFILIVMGSNAIRRAVQRDFTTDMLTSNRQTAMTGVRMAVGYLTGSTAQVLALTGANVLICAGLALVAQKSPLVAIGFLILIGCITFLCWTVALLIALATRGSTSLAGVLIVGIVVARIPVLTFVPGLTLLLGIDLMRAMQQFGGNVVTTNFRTHLCTRKMCPEGSHDS